MQVRRRGDVGPAVAEISSTLTALGLLSISAGSAQHAVFDHAVEHAVRTFQQQRGLITDGVVGPATFRALRDATYHLGGRPLAYLVSAPMTGDDVFALQEKLLELAWWDWPREKLEIALPDFRKMSAEEFVEKYS